MEVVNANEYKMYGDLTMLGITKQIPLNVEFGGIVERDPFGNTKAGFLLGVRLIGKTGALFGIKAFILVVLQWVKL